MRNTESLIGNMGKLIVGSTLAATMLVTSLACSAKPAAKEPSLEEVKSTINAAWSAAKPGIAIQDIEASEIPGIYKISAGHGPALYSTADGKNFLTGDLYRVAPGKIVNVSEEAKNGDRAKAVAGLNAKDLISFSPKGAKKTQVYVFTDVDCYYCQKLHANMQAMNDLGIEVHYLAYPRAGINSASYNKIASAWCAKDKRDAITKLKAKEAIDNNVCDGNPVASQYQLGQELGLTGTPALITEKGELIAGFMEPAALAQRLGL